MEKISRILDAQEVDMGGIDILQPLPQHAQNDLDPFLLIHHWKETLPGGQQPSELGVPPHPHKGFSPVTFIYKGELRHQDSLGNDSIVSAGGTQWMFSDNGIVHSERPGKKLAEKGGDFELIQFWVNSPAQFKFNEPRYVPLASGDTPQWSSEDGKVKVKVVAGKFNDLEGPIQPHSPMTILRIKGQPNGHLELPISNGSNACIYLLDGKAEVEGQPIEKEQMAVFQKDAEKVNINFDKETRILFLSGEPLNESVKTYGPFVMNTSKEIMNALEEAKSGKFGRVREIFD